MSTTTRERPVVFSGDSVRAILEGRKSATRRVIKPQPDPSYPPFYPLKVTFGLGLFASSGKHQGAGMGDFYPDTAKLRLHRRFDELGGNAWQHEHDEWTCPYGQPGDHLWVRETFRALEDPGAHKSEVRRKYREDDETHFIVVDYKADGPHTRIMDKLGKPEWKSPIFMPRWASRLTLRNEDIRVERLQVITEADAIAEGLASAWNVNSWVWVITFAVVSDAGRPA